MVFCKTIPQFSHLIINFIYFVHILFLWKFLIIIKHIITFFFINKPIIIMFVICFLIQITFHVFSYLFNLIDRRKSKIIISYLVQCFQHIFIENYTVK